MPAVEPLRKPGVHALVTWPEGVAFRSFNGGIAVKHCPVHAGDELHVGKLSPVIHIIVVIAIANGPRLTGKDAAVHVR